jgi:bifunctional non-homologous end joining protein LigD
VIRVEFADWTADDLLRQAAFKGMEIGKAPTSVRREREMDTTTATAAAEREVQSDRMRKTDDDAAALDAIEREGTWAAAGREVRVTNLEKVIFPGRDGGKPVTKRDLFRYHLAIGPTLVPYLRDHGLTVQRFPNGVEQKGFWQKDLPKHAPPWLKRWTYHHREEGPKDYPVVDEPATLLWLAQEAAVELHPWTSPIQTPDRPSYALIDIDPGPDTTWDEVVSLARLYRTALDHLGVRGHAKVTGKRGIQIWIGIRPGYAFDETRDWVEGLSRAVASTVPDLVSWEWVKRARKGKARLDFTQNAINKTLVAPYSPRPAPGAPVSMPIAWDELEDPALRPDRWTIHDVPARLAERGDLFAPLLDDRQELPGLG